MCPNLTFVRGWTLTRQAVGHAKLFLQFGTVGNGQQPGGSLTADPLWLAEK